MDREAHLNYYDSAYNRGRQLSHRKKHLNQIRQNKHASLTKNKKYKILKTKLTPGLVASYDFQPGNGVGLFWLSGKRWKIKKIDEATKEGERKSKGY